MQLTAFNRDHSGLWLGQARARRTAGPPPGVVPPEYFRQERPHMFPFALYLITGIATAAPVIYALEWAVWGAPIVATKYLSLLGSATLLVAAFTSLFERRIAARIALVGVLAIWSLYLPAITGAVRTKLSDQRLTLHVVRWVPSPQPLTVSDSAGETRPETRLTRAEIEHLKEAGVTGRVETFSLGIYGNGNKSSRTIIVIQNPVASPVELPEPNATTVVYVQHGDSWRLYPASAPTLRRTIRIEPRRDDPRQSSIMVELSSGARQGFSVWWPKPELGTP